MISNWLASSLVAGESDELPSEDDVRESGRDVARVIEYPGRETFFFLKLDEFQKISCSKFFFKVLLEIQI